MTGSCAVCGDWLDDVESATVPCDRCWDHKGRDLGRAGDATAATTDGARDDTGRDQEDRA